MKNCLKISLLALTVLASSCHTPDELVAPSGNLGLNSISAQFATGPNKTDALATFTTAIADAEQERIVITVPYYYPESSDDRTSITEMRVFANLDNNCFISPKLSTLDLTKENWFTLTRADGTKKRYCVTGEIRKSNKCEVLSFKIDDPKITGIVDTDAKTISLITLDELSAATATVITSPHSTVSPDLTQPQNYADGMEFTVTADDGVTKATYTVSKVVPPKVKYGWRKGSEVELWKNATINTSYGIVNAAGANYTLAASGDDLILSTGAKKYLFNRLTGSPNGEVDMKGVTTDGAVTSDAKGNILYATLANPGATFTIYTAASTTVTPTVLLTYTNATGASVGKHVSVQGDVTNNAVITAPIYTWNGAVCKFLRWVVTNGTVAAPTMVTATGAGGGWNGNGHADVVAASTNPADPYFMAYYSANSLFRLDGTGAMTHTIGTAEWGANSNYNCVDVCDFNNAKYAAIYTGSHFTYGEFLSYMYDVTTPDQMTGLCNNSPSRVFTSKQYTPPSAINATSDVLMVASEDGYLLHLYYTDGNCNSLVAWQFDCIDK